MYLIFAILVYNSPKKRLIDEIYKNEIETFRVDWNGISDPSSDISFVLQIFLSKHFA